MSKHEDIIKYINSLPAGTKISVRSIANDLDVSEGTAYRAIKDCDTLGIVTTISRVGTVKIEKVEKKSIEALNFGEVINIVDGTLLGGKEGIYKTLNRFLIGAMTVDAMEKYITPGSLLIVGNREEVQKLALMKGAGVLITGGFGCSDEIKKLANEKGYPVISSSYDTFTVATMINKAISESLIKKDILLVEDAMSSELYYLKAEDTISDFKGAIKKSNHERFPVVDEAMKVVGIVSIKDIHDDTEDDDEISQLMNDEVITVTPKTTIAYAAHIMGWEGIEMCPVVEGKRLIGVITREDVIRALQHMSRQPQISDTIEDMILKNFTLKENNERQRCYSGKVIPEMLDSIGTASWGSLNMLLSSIGVMTLRQKNNINVSVDSMCTYFMRPVQMDSMIEIYAENIDMGRNFCKVEIDIYDSKKELIAKSLLSAQILRK